MDNVLAHQGQDFRLDQTGEETLDKPWDNYKQILLQL